MAGAQNFSLHKGLEELDKVNNTYYTFNFLTNLFGKFPLCIISCCKVCKLFQTTFFKLLSHIIFCFKSGKSSLIKPFFVQIVIPENLFVKCVLELDILQILRIDLPDNIITNNCSRSKLYKMEFTVDPIFSSFFVIADFAQTEYCSTFNFLLVTGVTSQFFSII